MKKVITICLLVVTLLVGGMTMDAKTTKKKGKARTAQTSSSNINNLLDQYESAVDILSPYYDEESESLFGWGSDFIKLCNREEKLYQKLKKLQKNMTSEQKEKFNDLATSLNIR